VRGLLWITGRLEPLGDAAARARAVTIAETRTDHRLLDLGHGVALLRLIPASPVLADAEGMHSLRPHPFSAASPDPLHRHQAAGSGDWSRNTPRSSGSSAGTSHKELHDGRIRPLGLDQFGLRLRVEAESGDHDVRLASSRPVHSPPQLAVELRRLLGCPFLARQPAPGNS
jgi:hypothetical protein